jgi:hydroxymethylbilane synthase
MAPPHPPNSSSDAKRVIGLGTRKSPLAMVQAHAVRDQLKEIAPQYDYEIKAINTMGDKNKEISLQAFNAKSLWTQELETMLEEKEIDIIIHCLKGIT